MSVVKICNLKYLAKIRTGVTLREAIKPVDNGSISIIQIRDVRSNNEIDYQGITKTELRNIKSDLFLKKGDILLRAKGSNRGAAIFELEQGNFQAANQFWIISVNEDEILPEYLHWFINQKRTQHRLARNSQGPNSTTIASAITASAINNLEIIVPAMEKQQSIAKLQKLYRKEEMLIQDLITNRKQMMNAIISDLTKEANTVKGKV